MTFTFPLGFSIQATKKGVSFAGSSPNFGLEQIERIQKFLRYAIRIHKELKADRGIPPVAELRHEIRLRVRIAETRAMVWYEGYFNSGQEGATVNEAVNKLRYMYRTLHASD